MSLMEFKSVFQGGARPSLYRVSLSFPAGVQGANPRKAELLCKGAQLPASNIPAVPVFYMGRQTYVAGDRTSEEIQLTFITDVDFEPRTSFEKWMNLINGTRSNLGVVNPNQYKTDIIVTALGRDGKPLKSYKLEGCFPTNVSAADLSYDSTDTVMELTVSLSVDFWTNESVQ